MLWHDLLHKATSKMFFFSVIDGTGNYQVRLCSMESLDDFNYTRARKCIPAKNEIGMGFTCHTHTYTDTGTHSPVIKCIVSDAL